MQVENPKSITLYFFFEDNGGDLEQIQKYRYPFSEVAVLTPVQVQEILGRGQAFRGNEADHEKSFLFDRMISCNITLDTEKLLQEFLDGENTIDPFVKEFLVIPGKRNP